MKLTKASFFFLCIFLFLSDINSQEIILSSDDKLNAFQIFKELLAIPNDAHFHGDIEKNIQWCISAFEERGFSTKRLNTASPIPLLLAEYGNKIQNEETFLIYLQIDGQPVDTNFWWQNDPYEATLKRMDNDGEWIALNWDKTNGDLNSEWRIFARSASDAKGPVAMFLQAIDIIHNRGLEIPFNLKVIMDFEEELGSPNLAKGVELNRSELTADHLIIFDGPMHPSLLPTLSFGARGITTVTLKVHGPNFPQHSGHYGNYVPNPALTMTQLLATFNDEKGRVLVDGWYDGIIIDPETKKILGAVPHDEDGMRVKMGFARPDAVADTYQESIQYPSLNIRGMLAGWVGSEARTIIPAQATAEIDIRTVKESDPIDLLDKLKSHIENQGFFVVNQKPTLKEKLTHPKMVEMDYKISYQAFRTELDSPTGLWLRKAMIRKNGSEPVMKRTSGGSIPISPFVKTLGIPAVTVPTVNPDNNQHSPNENIRVGNFLDGIVTMVCILTERI